VQVRSLGAIAFELETEEAVVAAGDAAEAYVVFAVLLSGIALFDLFEVAQAVCLVTLTHSKLVTLRHSNLVTLRHSNLVTLRHSKCGGADGEGAVGKVHEQFAAVEVVGAEGPAGAAALWGMGQHQDGQVEVGLEGLEALHQPEGHGGAFGTAAQAGNIIDDEHGGIYQAYLFLDGHEDEVVIQFGVGAEAGVGVKLGAHKIVREVVIAARSAVTDAELRGAELEVEVKHFYGQAQPRGKGCGSSAAREGVGNLHGQDGFAGIGGGKQDAEFALAPKIAEEGFLRGHAGAEFEPAVAGANGKQVARLAEVGRRCGFLFAADRHADAADFGADFFDKGRAFGRGVGV